MECWKKFCLTAFVTFVVADPARSEFVGNVGVTSNYLWRGETQSNDGPAVFGGLDYANERGFYLGGRTSTISSELAGDREQGLVNQDYEIDLYTGFKFGGGPLDFDIGYISYFYPRGDRFNPETNRLEPGTDNGTDFAEIYLGVRFRMFGARYSYSDDYRGTGDSLNYLEANAMLPLWDDISLGLHLGRKDGDPVDDTKNRVADYHAVLTKGAFSLMVSNMFDNEDGRQSDNPRFSATWLHRLDF